MREIEELAGEKSELLAQIKSLTEEVSGYQNRIRETKSQTNEKQGLPHLSALSFLTSSSSLCLPTVPPLTLSPLFLLSA
jgi:cell division septum initiation protein DivIVA